MDLLGDILAISGVRGAVGARIEAGSDWGWWWSSPVPRAALHAITSGTAWLGLPGQAAVQLMPGDVVLLAAGPDHLLASDPGALGRTSEDLHNRWRTGADGTVRIGTDPVQAHILCADYSHDSLASTQLLSLLPDMIHIRPNSDGGLLDDTVRLLGRELAHPQLATGVVLDRLVDVLLVQLIRAWLATGPPSDQPSWLGALGDPVIGDAVARLHTNPSRAWNTDLLAGEVGVSRSTLSQTVQRSRRRTAGRLSHPLADGPRRPSAPRYRRHPGNDRDRHRLRLRLRVQPRLPPRPITTTRPVPNRISQTNTALGRGVTTWSPATPPRRPGR
jgi:hypothetical protein